MELLDDDVLAAVRGDRAAIAHVLGVIRPMVVHYCRARVIRNVSHVVSADDLAQEVCIAVLRALPQYRDQGVGFMPFVYGITAHKIADMYRSASRSNTTPVAEFPDLPGADAGPEQRALQSEAARQMRELLGTLTARQREVLILRVVAGFSASDTAAMVGSTAGTVRVMQHRALTKLRAQIAV